LTFYCDRFNHNQRILIVLNTKKRAANPLQECKLTKAILLLYFNAIQIQIYNIMQTVTGL